MADSLVLAAVPDAVIVAFAGAIVAALSYVAKTFVQLLESRRTARAQRLARLLELHSLLSAGRTAFRVQRDQAGRLEQMLRYNHHDSNLQSYSLERLFSSLYEDFNEEERDLHLIVRGYTEHAMRPINESVLAWLRSDIIYRTQRQKGRNHEQLAMLLNQLEAHLLLWFAKYQVWIPDRPEHALVYMADEDGHGLGFPVGIENVLASVLPPGLVPKGASRPPATA